MRKIIVTAMAPGAACGLDLEVPADLAARSLAPLIARLLLPGRQDSGETELRLEAHPPGRLLEPGETLAEAGAWDGAWLVLQSAPDQEKGQG